MSKLNSWSELRYWESTEWQTVRERLDAFDAVHHPYNPTRTKLFSALDVVPLHEVHVAIIGQDPYPDSRIATGIAFDAPGRTGTPGKETPPSLRNIFREYCTDLHYPTPKDGSLTTWCSRGVLLWNTYPTCETGKPGSHHWPEWYALTREIVETLDARGNVVFALLGGCARQLRGYITRSPVVETAHPAPLGANKGFLGSRLFSTINGQLSLIKQPTINWLLP